MWLLGLPEKHRPHSHPPQFWAFPGTDYLYLNLPSSRIRFVYDGDPRGYFGPGNQVDHHTNSLGFRGGEFSQEKPRDTVRFLFLGDSFTFGEGVRDEDTLPEEFRRVELNRNAFPGKQVEALNLGVGGFNTTQEAALLRDRGIALRPDRIIVDYSLNDAEPALFFRNRSGGIERRDRELEVPEYLGSPATPTPLSFLRLTSLAYRAYWNLAATRRTVEYYKDLYRAGSPGWDQTRAALSDIAATARTGGAKVTVMIFPVLFHLNSGYPFLDLHAKVRDAAHAAGLECLDLYPVYRGYSGPELWVHPTDQHPNEVALRLAARSLADFLATDRKSR